MEKLGVTQFSDVYRGKRVLVTGHTGFKGSWLALWLRELGANVIGVALPPKGDPNHWDLLQLAISEYHIDIRDIGALEKVFEESRPEIVFHLAAQPLVRSSYRDPITTWSTNVMGTVNVLEACRKESSVRAIVAITTDKCYENREWPWGYRENDRLGGHDPYSASKAGAELVAASYRNAFFGVENAPLLATARAGNVMGGGDWSEDRLIPDLVRSIEQGLSLEIRSLNATRPWQHVLESLSGYLRLGQKLLMKETSCAEAWNFGPEPEGNQPVSQVLRTLKRHWKDLLWHVTALPQPHEATLLYLDSAKAREFLGWKPVWDFDTSLLQTALWYRRWLDEKVFISRTQLLEYISAAKKQNLVWAE